MKDDKPAESTEKTQSTSLKGFSKPKSEMTAQAVIKAEDGSIKAVYDDTNEGTLDNSLVRASENVQGTACKPFIPKIKIDEEILKLSMKWQLKEGLIFRLGVHSMK